MASATAHALLGEMAAAFGPVDRAEAARQAKDYARRLFLHAARYGGPGTDFAIDRAEAAQGPQLRRSAPDLWARLQNDHGVFRLRRASLTAGSGALRDLGAAISALEGALSVWSVDTEPEDWAGACNNLAMAQWLRGVQVDGPPGAADLENAVASLNRAFAAVPPNATTDLVRLKTNLGNALAELAIRPEQSAPERFAAAAEAYGTALQYLSEADTPEAWAWALTCLAAAQSREAAAAHRSPERARALLDEALGHLEASRRVRSQADRPLDWAKTTGQMAKLKRHTAGRLATAERERALAEARLDAMAALEVFDPDFAATDWTEVTITLARIELDLAHSLPTRDQASVLANAAARADAVLALSPTGQCDRRSDELAELRAAIANVWAAGTPP